MASRTKQQPDQVPMSFLVPETSWEPPTELPDLVAQGVRRVCIDLETCDQGLQAGRGAGWAVGAGWVAGVGVGWDGGALYVPVRHPETQCYDHGAVGRWLTHLVRSGVEIVTQNGAYDYGWMGTEWGVPLPVEGQVLDIQALAVLLDENRLSYDLDSICRWQGVEGKDLTVLVEAARAFGVAKTREEARASLWRLPARFVGAYAEADVTAPLRLCDQMVPQVHAQDLWEAVRLECDLIPMVTAMRRRGIRVDTDGAERAIRDLHQRAVDHLRELSRQLSIGRAVTLNDIRSPGFLEKAFTAAGIPYHKTEKSKRGSFQKDWMEGLDHWLPKNIVQVKRLYDTADKFIQGFILDYCHRGRVHAEINQLRDASEEGGSRGTRSYRFSYSDPALQQMPSPKRDKEMGKIVRDVFIPEDGELWAKADYSQQEFRLMVHFASLLGLSRVEEAVERYRSDPKTDFHNVVVELTGLSRPEAKDCNFAKAFGAGKKKFALMTGRTEDEAASLMDEYDEHFPFIKRLSESYQSAASRRGYIRLIDGARCRFDLWEPGWDYKGRYFAPTEREEALRRTRSTSYPGEPTGQHPWFGQQLRRAFTHKAMNRGIQGSAARQTKIAMRNMWREGITPLLQLHDELDDSVAGPREARRLSEIMQEAVTLQIPVLADVEVGPSWGSADQEI